MEFTETYFTAYGDQPFRWKHWAAYIRKHYPTHTPILEVGCAYGYLFTYLTDYTRLKGVDISPHAITQAKKLNPHAEFIINNLQKLPYEDDSIELALAFDVLEHLSLPEPALKEIMRVLKPGGTIIMSVPNTTSYSHKKKNKQWFAYQDPTHQSLLSPEQWQQELVNQGMHIEKATGIDLFDFPHFNFIAKALNYLLYTVHYPYISFGDNYLIIAKKITHTQKDQ